MTDEEFERAIRTGITPDSTSMWVMPAMDYAYMSEDDVTAIVSYLRTLKAMGAAAPQPIFDMPARFAIARGDLEPIASRAPESPTSLDLGSTLRWGSLSRAYRLRRLPRHGSDGIGRCAGSEDRRALQPRRLFCA